MDTAVILAGGLGTRLRGSVPDVPKPMAPVAGRPFLEFLLDYWIAQGIQRFILSTGHGHDIIADHFGDGYGGTHIEYAREESPLDTGGALLGAADLLGDPSPFLLLNGDTYFAADAAILRAFSMSHDADWSLGLWSAAAGTRSLGVGVDADGRITSLGSSGSEQGNRLVNGGVYCVHPRALAMHSALKGQRVSLEHVLLPAGMAAGQRIFGIEFSAAFIDIGVPDDFHRAHEVLPLPPRASPRQ